MILNVYVIKELHYNNALVVKEYKDYNSNALVVKIKIKNALADKQNATAD
jgi:hypothetical protein